MKNYLGYVSTGGLLLATLLLNGACGQSGGGSGSKQLIKIPDSVSNPSASSGSSLALLDSGAVATSLDIKVSGCASGWTTDCTAGTFDVYFGDLNCIAKLNSFVSSGKTYNASSACSSISWQAGSQCSFVNAANSSDSVIISVVQQLSSPTVSTNSVVFEWGEVGTGTAQLYSANTLGFAVNDSLAALVNPQYQISNLLYYGVNTNGSGKFGFDLLCDQLMTVDSANSTQGKTLCESVPLSTLSYALVAYPSGVSLSASELALLMSTATVYTVGWQGASDSSSSDKLAAGNGGFVTKIMNGPGLISSSNNMLLILREQETVQGIPLTSYTSYQVQLAALPGCNC